MRKQKKAKPEFETLKVLTPTFRASYLTVFEPRPYEDNEPKYSVDMLFDPSDADFKKFKKKFKEVAAKAWGEDEEAWPKNFAWPFKNGDEREDENEHYVGKVYLRADSKNQPGIFDQNKEDIIDKKDIQSGYYCRASVVLSPYENIGGKGTQGRSGIKVYLQGIQLVKKAEPFGGNGSRDDFDVVESDDIEDSDDDAGF